VPPFGCLPVVEVVGEVFVPVVPGAVDVVVPLEAFCRP